DAAKRECEQLNYILRADQPGIGPLKLLNGNHHRQGSRQRRFLQRLGYAKNKGYGVQKGERDVAGPCQQCGNTEGNQAKSCNREQNPSAIITIYHCSCEEAERKRGYGQGKGDAR